MNGRLLPILPTLLVAVTVLTPAGLRAAVPPPNGPGSALIFDGVNDHVSATPTTLPTGNAPCTIEAWIKVTALGAGGFHQRKSQAAHHGGGRVLHRAEECGGECEGVEVPDASEER